MNTVELLNRRLDLEPLNQELRLVLADAEQDEGNLWGVGYIALAKCNLCPALYRGYAKTFDWFSMVVSQYHNSVLPMSWLLVLNNFQPPTGIPGSGLWWKSYPSRRTAEEAACRAFVKLPECSRIDFLSGR